MQAAEQSKVSNETKQEGQNAQTLKFYSSKLSQLVPEARQFSFLVQALPIVSMSKLRALSLYHYRSHIFAIHPAAMVTFSRGLNLILARIILNSIFVHDSSSTLRSTNRDICAGAEHAFELDPYLSNTTIPDYPLMKNLLYSLKRATAKAEKAMERSSTSFDESCEIENLKSKLLLHYVSESKYGSCCRRLVLSRYAKSLTAVHIREGQLLCIRLADIFRSQRAHSQCQLYPHLTPDQKNVHQLSLIPFINWVQVLIYNLPYKYELMLYIRSRSIMDITKDNLVMWHDNAPQSSPPTAYNPKGTDTITHSNTEACIGDRDCTISADRLESGMYSLVDYWVRMSFFYHVTDFSVYDIDKPQNEQTHTTQHYPMYTRPEKIDGISIKKLEEAFLLRYNLQGPREQDVLLYIGET